MNGSLQFKLVLAVVVLLACFGSIAALNLQLSKQAKTKEQGLVRAKVLEFLRKSLTKAGDDHDNDHDHDHDHFPEPNWFIDALYANLTTNAASNDTIYVEGIS